MHIETSVRITAPADRIWSILIDVERWPEWTASTERAVRLDDGPLGLGGRVTIKQPKLREMTWTVIEFTPLKSFAWEARLPGLVIVGTHQLQDHGVSASEVTLTLDQTGVVGRAFGPLTGKLARRYVEMEAKGLKTRSEAEA